MSTSLAKRPLYTREQLSEYIQFIFGRRDTLEIFEREVQSNPLQALGYLQKHHLGRIPWG